MRTLVVLYTIYLLPSYFTSPYLTLPTLPNYMHSRKYMYPISYILYPKSESLEI